MNSPSDPNLRCLKCGREGHTSDECPRTFIGAAVHANGVMSLALQRLRKHALALVELEQRHADPADIMVQRIRCAQFEALFEIARRKYIAAVCAPAEETSRALRSAAL